MSICRGVVAVEFRHCFILSIPNLCCLSSCLPRTPSLLPSTYSYRGIAGFFAIAGIVFSILTAVDCDFFSTPELDLGFGGTSVGVGIFKAQVTVAGTKTCDGFNAQNWQDYVARSLVCGACIFAFFCLLEFIGTEAGCMRRCIGCCVCCAGPSLAILAMVCQGLTFLLLADRVSGNMELGNGAWFSITACCCYAIAACLACMASSGQDDPEDEDNKQDIEAQETAL